MVYRAAEHLLVELFYLGGSVRNLIIVFGYLLLVCTTARANRSVTATWMPHCLNNRFVLSLTNISSVNQSVTMKAVSMGDVVLSSNVADVNNEVSQEYVNLWSVAGSCPVSTTACKSLAVTIPSNSTYMAVLITKYINPNTFPASASRGVMVTITVNSDDGALLAYGEAFADYSIVNNCNFLVNFAGGLPF